MIEWVSFRQVEERMYTEKHSQYFLGAIEARREQYQVPSTEK